MLKSCLIICFATPSKNQENPLKKWAGFSTHINIWKRML
nr:MAG TPA: hypothetical protein [Caudoviricetes sp.]